MNSLNQCRRAVTFAFITFALWAASADAQDIRQFRAWATSCSHVPADIERGHRESLAKAIRQSEGYVENVPAFDWDIMIDAGDCPLISSHRKTAMVRNSSVSTVL